MKENFEQELINSLVSKINSEKDQILIKGLNLKGYLFSNDVELINFIKEHCRAEQYNEEMATKTTYYVKDEPFLYIESNPIEPLECDWTLDDFSRKLIIQGDRYKFL